MESQKELSVWGSVALALIMIANGPAAVFVLSNISWCPLRTLFWFTGVVGPLIGVVGLLITWDDWKARRRV